MHDPATDERTGETTTSPKETDQTKIGSAQPKLTYGWNNTLNWKKWSLNLFFQGTVGNKIFNALRAQYNSVNLISQGKNVLKEALTEQKYGDVNSQYPSDRYLENGSYLRLATLTLSYNLGQIGNGVHIADFIYAMPYDCVNAKGLIYGRYRTFRKIDDGEPIGYYGAAMNKSCAGIVAMNPEFADLFSLEGDDRNSAVLGGKVYVHDPLSGEETDQPYLYKGEQLEFTKEITLKAGGEEQLNAGADANGWRQGWRSIKFYPNPYEYSAYDRSQSNDVPIFRYADVLLTKAEAILRGANATNGDTPESLFNQIRGYVHAPLLDHTPSLQELLDERGRELFDENWRRNDMIRFGTFENEYGFHKKDFPNAQFDKRRRIFPVPQNVMNENTN